MNKLVGGGLSGTENFGFWLRILRFCSAADVAPNDRRVRDSPPKKERPWPAASCWRFCYFYCQLRFGNGFEKLRGNEAGYTTFYWPFVDFI